jgi:hypothetical protein
MMTDSFKCPSFRHIGCYVQWQYWAIHEVLEKWYNVRSYFVRYNRCVSSEKRVWLLLMWITMWIPGIISHFLCNGLIELSPTFRCEYYFLLYTFKCVPNIFFCYMINLHNSVTIFMCIYLLEHFATFNMGVYMCMCGCWCGSLCICTTIIL